MEMAKINIEQRQKYTIDEAREMRKDMQKVITNMLQDYEERFGVKIDFVNYNTGDKPWEDEKNGEPKTFKFDVEL
jgi:Trm5-related predicted tRNA methylase